MEGDYNFWQDFFDTYQSLSDWMKLAWLVVPPMFLLGVISLIMRYRIASKQADRLFDGDLIYTVYRDTEHQLQVYRHSDMLGGDPRVVLLEGKPVMQMLSNGNESSGK